MVTLWVVKIKLGMSKLSDVSAHHYDNVLAQLVKEGLYDEQGNKIEQ